MLIEEAKKDARYQEVAAAVNLGTSKADVSRLPVDSPCQEFRYMWECLGTTPVDKEGNHLLVANGSRVCVPLAARKEVLKHMHAGHLGVGPTLAITSERYFWHGMKNQVSKLCTECQECLPLKATKGMEVAVLENPPAKPMEKCGLDLFTYESKTYGLLVDCYSQFLFVKEFQATPDMREVTQWLETIFHSQGFPLRMRMDGGPQMRSEMGEFCRRAKIDLEKSSAGNPQSNGAAENGVKQVKSIF